MEEKVNKFESLFKKINKTLDEVEFSIDDFSDSDEENQSFTNDIHHAANRSLNNSFFEANLTKRSTISKRKAKRFNPLRCIDERRKSTRNQTSILKQNCKSSRNEQDDNNGLEREIFDMQETQIDWESSGDSELNTTVFKELTNITNTTSTTQLAGNERHKSNEYTKNLFRRCRKGSYLHKFKQAIDKAKTDQKFLKYDQKFGMRLCQTLLILKITQSFGVYVARCRMDDDNEIEVILDRNMGKHVKIGDQLEAFFDETNEAYEIGSSQLPIVLQPKRILTQI